MTARATPRSVFSRHSPQTIPAVSKILDGPATGSAKDNFLHLLRVAPSAPYYAFCDQDDVWDRCKLEILMTECRALEHDTPAGTPCLVSSDLVVVDESLRTLAGSFWMQIDGDPRRTTLGSLLMENHIPGCAMLFNDALRGRFLEYGGDLRDAVMHDWWLALLAQALGRMSFVSQPLVQYRQHGANSMGSVNRRGGGFMLAKLRSKDGMGRALRQGALFCRAYGEEATGEAAATLTAFASLAGKSKLARIRLSLRHGLLKQTYLRRVYQMIKI